MNYVPDNPNALLARERTAAALTAAGYPVTTKTLDTKATRGGGPPYRLFSGRALYRVRDLLDWAQNATSPPRHRLPQPNVESPPGEANATLNNNSDLN